MKTRTTITLTTAALLAGTAAAGFLFPYRVEHRATATATADQACSGHRRPARTQHLEPPHRRTQRYTRGRRDAAQPHLDPVGRSSLSARSSSSPTPLGSCGGVEPPGSAAWRTGSTTSGSNRGPQQIR
ncbi:hypothetical protein QP028_12955 [Corynebacterium suedekumii]|nr:hypothetical protein QP028_12955 [Corynebacterium suedekumii]